MKEITISLDEEVIRWARIRAAERGISLSRLVGELLWKKMVEEITYSEARQHYIAQEPGELKCREDTYLCREELYEH